MFLIKLHRGPTGDVLAVSDESILGQSFSEGKLRLDVSEGFYGGISVSEEDLIDYLERSSLINITGNDAVGIAIREGYVDEKCVLVIGGVKHAQVLK